MMGWLPPASIPWAVPLPLRGPSLVGRLSQKKAAEEGEQETLLPREDLCPAALCQALSSCDVIP